MESTGLPAVGALDREGPLTGGGRAFVDDVDLVEPGPAEERRDGVQVHDVAVQFGDEPRGLEGPHGGVEVGGDLDDDDVAVAGVPLQPGQVRGAFGHQRPPHALPGWPQHQHEDWPFHRTSHVRHANRCNPVGKGGAVGLYQGGATTPVSGAEPVASRVAV